MTLDDLLIDKRIVRRNIEKGRLDAATYQGLLDQLPDRSANVWRPDAGGTPEAPRAPAAAPAPAQSSEERAEAGVGQHASSMPG